jgi:hypothetical protein
MVMPRKWIFYLSTAACAIAAGHAWAQAPQVVTLYIEWENAVVYIDGVG